MMIKFDSVMLFPFQLNHAEVNCQPCFFRKNFDMDDWHRILIFPILENTNHVIRFSTPKFSKMEVFEGDLIDSPCTWHVRFYL